MAVPRTQVADGVHLVTGTNVNWVLVTDGDACTLVDTGYRGDRGRLLASLADLGRSPADVAAVLITHGHLDHVGSAAWLARQHGVRVLAGPAELPHLRGDVVEQISPVDFLLNARTVAGARWVAQTLRATRGELHPRTPTAATFEDAAEGTDASGSNSGAGAGRLDLPGRPVAVPTPGHTSGHTCWWLPETRVMLTGDALVTGHPLLPAQGPQLLPAAFHHDEAAVARILDELVAVAGADEPVTIVPGHGAPWQGPMEEAVRRAREA